MEDKFGPATLSRTHPRARSRNPEDVLSDYGGLSDVESAGVPETFLFEDDLVVLTSLMPSASIEELEAADITKAKQRSIEDSCVSTLPVWSHDPYNVQVLPPMEPSDDEDEPRFSVLPAPAAAGEYPDEGLEEQGFDAYEAYPEAFEAGWDPSGHAVESHLYSEHSSAAAVDPHRPGVMCCYHKSGRGCNKGDKCWYSHVGSPNTPCHYGASCKAGHAHLADPENITAINGAAPPARTSAGRRKPIEPVAHPQRRTRTYYYHRPNPHRSASHVDVDFPCPHCGSSGCVTTQQFPVYIGAEVTVGTRAHCKNCHRTYAL